MSHRPILTITVEAVEDARLIRASGDVDASTAPELRGHVEDAQLDAATLLLDLADVRFMDSAGLRVLLDAGRAAAENGWAFFIVRPSSTVQRLIELTSTGADLPLVRTSERALV